MFKKIFAVILLIVFAPIFILTVLSWNFKLTFLNSVYWQKQLEKSDFYEKALDIVPKYLLQSLMQNETIDLPFSDEQFDQAVEKNLSSEWLKSNIEKTIEQILGYLNGTYSTIEAEIDLRPVKNTINELNRSFLENQFTNLPECKSIKEFNPKQPNCRPPGMDLDELLTKMSKKDQRQTGKENIFENIPDSYNLGEILLKTNHKQNPILLLHQSFSRFKIGLYIMTTIVIILLLSIILLIFRPFVSVLKWLAVTFLIPGILIILTGLLTLNLMLFTGGLLITIPVDLKPIIESVISVFAKNIGFRLLFIGLATVFISIILYISAVIFKSKQETLQVKEENKKTIL